MVESNSTFGDIFMSKIWFALLRMAIIPKKYYHMNASVEDNLQLSLITDDLMNSLRK